MSEPEQAKRKRIARRVAAFELWLNNLPMAGRPDRGDPALRERAEKILAEQPPPGEGGEEASG